jgi:hypothetical protein
MTLTDLPMDFADWERSDEVAGLKTKDFYLKGYMNSGKWHGITKVVLGGFAKLFFRRDTRVVGKSREVPFFLFFIFMIKFLDRTPLLIRQVRNNFQ